MRRLTILIVAVGALLLVPVAQAVAASELHVELTGSGSGEVTSGTGGEFEGEPPIECSGPPATGTCDNTFEEVIFLEATKSPGSAFTGWTITGSAVPFYGCGEFQGKLEELCVLFDEGEGSTTATANFELNNLKLTYEEGSGTVVSNPAGLECTGSCEAFVAEGKYTLTASPAPGYLFKGWKGCETVNGRQCTVTATSSLKTVGVKFIPAFKLSATKSDPNGILSTSPGGVNCGYGCNSSSALYKEGSLTVKSKPAKHFHFVEFTGGTKSAESCNGVTAETCTFTISEDSAIEEVYAPDAKHTLTLSKTGGGQGFVKTKPTSINCGFTCTAAKGEFFFNEEAAVSVSFNKGTTQVTWTTGAGTCTGNAVTCAVPMSEDHTLVAKFE